MAHVQRDRDKLLARARRIRGQIESVERMLAEADDCTAILQQIAACRGAINGLMAAVLDGHLREHVIDASREPTRSEARAIDELAEILKRYLT